MRRLLAFLLLSSFLSLPVLADGQASLKVYVNGNAIGATAIEQNGVSYVPVTALALALGINILWNPNTEEIVVNGKPFSSVGLLKNGILYVPVEAIARGIGAPVEWDGREHAIRIQSGPHAVAAKTPPVEPVVQENPDASPSPAHPPADSGSGFYSPRTSANADFSVTVTNIEYSHLLKDYYKPGEGKRFVLIHVSEQNISDQIQMYTGKFSLEDAQGISYDYLDGLSNFYLQILRPGGINFGTLVFEIPEDDTPGSLVLSTYGNPPLRIQLQ